MATLLDRFSTAFLMRCALLLTLLLAGPAHSAAAQAPLGIFSGRWAEIGAVHHSVSQDYGDWRGAYVRTVLPAGDTDVFWAEAFALEAFGSRGVQVALAHRHDWNARFFTMLGGSVADGAPIFARVRVDAQAGVMLLPGRNLVAAAGVSHVRSVKELTDAAITAGLAWYLPHGIILESGLRANTSWPGEIQTMRFNGAATWMSPRRSFSARAIGGEEGWQFITANESLVLFDSHELSLAWRERIGERWSTALQMDRYENPSYTRTGITLGVARSW